MLTDRFGLLFVYIIHKEETLKQKGYEENQLIMQTK